MEGQGKAILVAKDYECTLPLNQPHIDLCAVGRQLGYRGGLKTIERRMGIERSLELQGFTGADAVRQWNRWRHRRAEGARELLVASNKVDCMNLEPLADASYCQLAQSTGLHEATVRFGTNTVECQPDRAHSLG